MLKPEASQDAESNRSQKPEEKLQARFRSEKPEIEARGHDAEARSQKP